MKTQFAQMEQGLAVEDGEGKRVLVDERRRALLEMDVTALLRELREGRVKAVEVFEAYQVRKTCLFIFVIVPI